ncbi:MAG: SAM-dependent chlorinase/fluorinase [Acidobacteriota bacterium]
MTIITLLTDFGIEDYYVGAVKGVLASRAPGTTLIDISHQVPPGEIDTATFLLQAAAPSFPAGTVHLAVVDPGVGTSRRCLAVAVDDAYFVAPDNGLLTPFVTHGEVVAVDRTDLDLATPRGHRPSHTFHGRDRFAPIAAALATGTRLTELGPRIDDAIVTDRPRPRREEGALVGHVVHIDRFGNAVTDIPATWLPMGPVVAEIAGIRVDRRVVTYDELPDDRPGLLIGSLQTVELSFKGKSFAALQNIAKGMQVSILNALPQRSLD